MERAFPGLRLEWTISDTGRLVPLPQRDAWVAKGRRDGPGFPLVCNGGDASSRVTISGWVLPAGSSPGGQAQFEVHADLPLDAAGIVAAADVLEAVGEGDYLGWLNYWSDAAARAVGFPDPARDADLLTRAWRTATGGWVVRLTDGPLDLDNPAHLDALLRAYERFPEVGGRSPP